ncbi:hypothetical protein OJF2_17740 [Aquisphaera giovannonii]|uniref:DUF937 domain-containing protein n=1 Tax=Aquisphaera giovannonii TaxID=406548 RepID=A0A5B9VY57_9BACT|nr:DUF937 domain-containing protein [Aquisphaera giovannonii]QEH33273.1 hypothetical protein OJF2_17740 [Aquisphaera giovannonii]
MNIVDAIRGQLTGDIPGRLASALGVSEDQIRSALDAGVPGLLALLGKVASSETGAGKLADALKQAHPDAGGGPGDILSGKDLSSLQEKGLAWLNSVLGPAALPVVISILGKFAGVGASQLKGLLGMLAPFILGMIAKQLSGRPLTSQAVSSFFEEQKANIAAASPAGLSFADVPGVGSVSGAAAAAASAARSTVATAREEAAGMPGWLLPLLGLVVVGGIAWYFLAGPGSTPPAVPGATEQPQGPAAGASRPAPTSTTPPAEPRKPAPEASKAAPGGTVTPAAESLAQVPTLTKDLGDAYASLAEILGGVKDAKAADAALPRLTDLSGKVDGYKATFDKLSEDGKAAIARVTAEHLAKVKELAETALKIPGLPARFEEVVRAVLAKLAEIKAA